MKENKDFLTKRFKKNDATNLPEDEKKFDTNLPKVGKDDISILSIIEEIDTTSFFKIFIVVCALAVLSSAILFVLYMGKAIFWGEASTNTGDIEASICIELIGIFATVVATSYIANALSKADVEKLNEDTDKLKKDTDELKKDTDELKKDTNKLSDEVKTMRPFVNKNKNILYQRFVEALDSTTMDVASLVLAESFKENPPEDDSDPDGDMGNLYYKMLELEFICRQVRIRHRSEYKFDPVLIKLSEKGRGLIENIKIGIQADLNDNDYEKLVGTKKDITNIKDYLDLRSLDLEFYPGYCAKSRYEGIVHFRDAAEQAKDYTKFFFYKKADDKGKLNHYFNNFIGECYSKITHFYSDELNKSKTSKVTDIEKIKDIEVIVDSASGRLEDIIKNVSDNAITHCENAAKGIENVDYEFASTYYRNYGCALERQDRVKEENDFKNYEKVIENYKESIKNLKGNYSIKAASAANAYYVLLSYYKKYWEYVNENVPEDLKKPQYFNSSNESDIKIRDLVKNMFWIAQIAKQDINRDSRLHYLYGFSCAYKIIWNRWYNLEPEKVDEDGNCEKYYLDEIISVIKNMELFDPKNGFMTGLNEYEKRLKNLSHTEQSS